MSAQTSDSIEAFEIINKGGKAPLVLVCEHASNFVPEKFNGLGLEPTRLNDHIAWDPGALDVAKSLASLLEAPLFAARISRLVYDCNRPPEASDAIPSVSEVYDIPGNTNLSNDDKSWRVNNIYTPFHVGLSDLIEQKVIQDQAPLIVTIHSFVPVYKGQVRETEIGILHDIDSRLADYILEEGKRDLDFKVARNEPYNASDGVTHTLQKQAIKKKLPNVMIEIRNDLIKDEGGVQKVAHSLARILQSKLSEGTFADKKRVSS
jgi:predicted N-formylglutamate amidohydrolase